MPKLPEDLARRYMFPEQVRRTGAIAIGVVEKYITDLKESDDQNTKLQTRDSEGLTYTEDYLSEVLSS